MDRNFRADEVRDLSGLFFKPPFFMKTVDSPEFCVYGETVEKIKVFKRGSNKRVEITLINEDEVLIVIFDGDGSSFFDTKKIKFNPEANDLVEKLKTISEYFRI